MPICLLVLPCASYLLASLLAKKTIDMDPHPLANLFKKYNYDELNASELSALDYIYEVLIAIVNLKIVMKC